MVERADTTMARARNSACNSASVMAGLASTRDRSRAWCGSRTGRRFPPIRPGATDPVSRTRRISFTAAEGLMS